MKTKNGTMSATSSRGSKIPKRMDIAVKDNKMLCIYKITKLIGQIVKIRHKDGKTICGVLYTLSNKLGLVHCMIKEEGQSEVGNISKS